MTRLTQPTDPRAVNHRRVASTGYQPFYIPGGEGSRSVFVATTSTQLAGEGASASFSGGQSRGGAPSPAPWVVAVPDAARGSIVAGPRPESAGAPTKREEVTDGPRLETGAPGGGLGRRAGGLQHVAGAVGPTSDRWPTAVPAHSAQRATEEPRLLRGRTRGIQHPDGSSSVAPCAWAHHLRRLAVAGTREE